MISLWWQLYKTLFTCLLFWVILLRVSDELELSARPSLSFSFLLTSVTVGLGPRIAAALLPTALDLLPVKLFWVAILGVLTTNEDRDRSFRMTGKEKEGVTSGALTFRLLNGKILALMSCRLWSGLHISIWDYVIGCKIRSKWTTNKKNINEFYLHKSWSEVKKKMKNYWICYKG